MEIESALDFAFTKGIDLVDDLIILGRNELRHQFRFARNQVVISKFWEEKKLDVFMAIGSKSSVRTIEEIQNESIIKKEIVNLTKFVKALPDNSMYKGINQKKTEIPKNTSQFYDSRVTVLPENAIDHIESAINQAQEEGAENVAGSFIIRDENLFLQTSAAIETRSKRSSYEMTVRAFADAESTGMGMTVGRHLDSFNSEKAGREAGLIAKKAKNGKKGLPGQYDLVLHPIVGADILGRPIKMANPMYIFLGMSCMGLERFGSKIGSDILSVEDNGTISDGLGSDHYDMEGVPRQTTKIIKNGVLTNYIHNSTTAAHFEMETTGNGEFHDFMGFGIRNFIPISSNLNFHPGDVDFEELLSMRGENGRDTVYITANWYTRFQNYEESTFSSIPRDGMFLISKNGEWNPIRQLRISDNMLNLLANVKALGKEQQQIKWWEVPRSVFIPHIRIADVRLTTGTM